jgi:hypothetical protein
MLLVPRRGMEEEREKVVQGLVGAMNRTVASEGGKL